MTHSFLCLGLQTACTLPLRFPRWCLRCVTADEVLLPFVFVMDMIHWNCRKIYNRQFAVSLRNQKERNNQWKPNCFRFPLIKQQFRAISSLLCEDVEISARHKATEKIIYLLLFTLRPRNCLMNVLCVEPGDCFSAPIKGCEGPETSKFVSETNISCFPYVNDDSSSVDTVEWQIQGDTANEDSSGKGQHSYCDFNDVGKLLGCLFRTGHSEIGQLLFNQWLLIRGLGNDSARPRWLHYAVPSPDTAINIVIDKFSVSLISMKR